MKITEFYTNDQGEICQDCGTSITQCYVLSDDIIRITVGSECAKRLSDGDPMIKRDISWIKRIKKEYQQTPVTETVDQFITRRLNEMRNAYRAYAAYKRLFPQDERYNALMAMMNQRILPFKDQWTNDNAPGFRQQISEWIEMKIAEIEQQYSANRIDFRGKKLNQVPQY